MAAPLHVSTNDTSDRLSLIGVGIVFTIIGLAVAICRLLVIVVRHRPLGNDDWAMLLAWLTSLGFAIAAWISVRWGVGYQFSNEGPFQPDAYIPKAIEAAFVIEIFYYMAIFFLKMSILFLYLRLADDLWNFFKKGTVVMMAIIVAQFVATVVVVGTQCVPTAKYWNPSIPGHCVDITAFFYSTNIFTIITDLMFLALPIPTLWKLNSPRSQKLGLIAAFLVGGVSTIASCVRLYSVALYTESAQPLRDAAPITTWSFIEINLGILCASVPAIKPLFMPPKRTTGARYYDGSRIGGKGNGSSGAKSGNSGRAQDPYLENSLFARSQDAIELCEPERPASETVTHDSESPPSLQEKPSRTPMDSQPQTSSMWSRRSIRSPELTRQRSDYQVSASKSSKPPAMNKFGMKEIMVSRDVEVEENQGLVKTDR